MKKSVKVAALGVVTAGCIAGLVGIKPTAPESGIPQKTIPQRIQEDDPLWDCRTMGNHICGPLETSKVDEATAWLKEMQPYCEAQGAAASTWVERHPPHHMLEVLGRCEGDLGA